MNPPNCITAYVYPGGGVDDYGDPLPGDRPPFTIRVAFEYHDTKENTDRRNQVITDLTLYEFEHAEVSARDKVKVAGTMYEVNGDPMNGQSPFTGWNPGQVIRLTRVTG